MNAELTVEDIERMAKVLEENNVPRACCSRCGTTFYCVAGFLPSERFFVCETCEGKGCS